VSVWQVFESAAVRGAGRTAVDVQRATRLETWTYGQLHTSALAHAGWLAASGLSAGDRCAILSDNDARWCAAYFGTLRLGAIVVPLDTSCTAVQIATIVGEARPRVLLVNQRLEPIAREALTGLDVTIRVLEDVPSTPQDPVALYDTAAMGPAVILYTSGTTAEPKGVVLTHANLLAERDAAHAVLKVTERDSVLAVLPLPYALGQLGNLLLPFTVGARVVFLETLTSN
jgi:long-chain acyl-CoA synthetase